MPNYGDPTYWDQRYQEQAGTTFDWLEDYPNLKPIFDEYFKDSKNDIKILNLGCGNSELSEEMYDDGYLNIVNIDISPVVIE